MTYREFIEKECHEFAFKPSEMTEEDRERLYDFLEDLNDAHPHSAFKNRTCKTCAKERFTGASPYKCDGCRNGSAYKPTQITYELKTTDPYGDYRHQWMQYHFINKEIEGMTMNAMVEYLEKRGFKATKTYLSNSKKYHFEISKDGKRATAEYTYNPYKTAATIDSTQRNFLDNLINDWKRLWASTVPNEKQNGLKSLDEIHWTVNAVEYNCGCACDFEDYEVTLTGTRKSHGYIHPDYIKAHLNEKLNGLVVDKVLTDNVTRVSIPGIKKVIFSNPATIVMWTDNTKTVVKADGEPYDPEKGLAMAIAKKSMGNNYTYYNTFKKWLKKAPNYEV